MHHFMLDFMRHVMPHFMRHSMLHYMRHFILHFIPHLMHSCMNRQTRAGTQSQSCKTSEILKCPTGTRTQSKSCKKMEWRPQNRRKRVMKSQCLVAKSCHCMRHVMLHYMHHLTRHFMHHFHALSVKRLQGHNQGHRKQLIHEMSNG